MGWAQNGDEGFIEQGRSRDIIGYAFNPTDCKVDLMAAQLIHGGGTYGEFDGKPGARGVFSQGRDERCREKRRNVIVGGDAKGTGGIRRNEGVIPLDRLFDKRENLIDHRQKSKCALGWFHAVRATDEQGVGEDIAQTRQTMADRRLSKTEIFGDAGGFAIADEIAHHNEQCEVEPSNIIKINSHHESISVIFIICRDYRVAINEPRGVMMQIAIIGAGTVGQALGGNWAKAGHRIHYGVRDPENPKHRALLDEIKGASVQTVSAAVQGVDAIVLAVMWHAVPDALQACGDLVGKIVIDVTNPLTFGADGLSLALGFSTSGGETVAALAPGAFVYKALNQVGSAVMADARGYAVPPTMFVAGDEKAHKPLVMGLIEDLGFAALDAGGLSVARLLEPYAMLWIHMVLVQGRPADGAFALLNRSPAS